MISATTHKKQGRTLTERDFGIKWCRALGLHDATPARGGAARLTVEERTKLDAAIDGVPTTIVPLERRGGRRAAPITLGELRHELVFWGAYEVPTSNGEPQAVVRSGGRRGTLLDLDKGAAAGRVGKRARRWVAKLVAALCETVEQEVRRAEGKKKGRTQEPHVALAASLLMYWRIDCPPLFKIGPKGKARVRWLTRQITRPTHRVKKAPKSN